MRAATQDKYGIDAINVTDEPVPEPGPGQVRVKIEVASMNPLDWHFALGRPRFVRLLIGLRRPKERVIGSDFCGTVDAVGPDVGDAAAGGFDVGEAVFGSARTGAFAEYALAKVDRIARQPSGMTAGEAAGLPIAGITALQSFEDIDLKDKRVVINGASGGVGHYAIQIAKALGAAHVTAVCSTRNLDLVKGLGADDVIDYTVHDFTTRTYDVVLTCAGRRSFNDIKRCLAPDGHWVMVGPEKGGPIIGPLPAIMGLTVRSKLTGLNFNSFTAAETKERLDNVTALANSGELRTHIEREYSLDEVRDVFHHAGTHRTQGKITIRI